MGDWCRKYKSISLKRASEISFDRSGKTQDQPNREKVKKLSTTYESYYIFFICKCHPRRPLPFTSSVLTAGMLTCTARGSCSCRDGELVWLCAGPLIFAVASTPGSTAFSRLQINRAQRPYLCITYVPHIMYVLVRRRCQYLRIRNTLFAGK